MTGGGGRGGRADQPEPLLGSVAVPPIAVRRASRPGRLPPAPRPGAACHRSRTRSARGGNAGPCRGEQHPGCALWPARRPGPGSGRRRIASDCRKSEGHWCLGTSHCACRQLELHHLASHLILKPEVRKIHLSWSNVTESNHRPSPYHAWRVISDGVQPGRITRRPYEYRCSEHVVFCLPSPGAVVTWFATRSRPTTRPFGRREVRLVTEAPSPVTFDDHFAWRVRHGARPAFPPGQRAEPGADSGRG